MTAWWPAAAGAVASIAVPLALGYAALTAVAGRVLSRGERFGLAYPCGATVMTLCMYALGHVGMPFDRWSFALVAGGLALACALVAARRGSATALPPPDARMLAPAPALTALLAALLGLKVVFVLFDLLRRPLSPWDSFSVWGLRAKVWATAGGLVLDPHQPFYLGGVVRPDYPPHVSLLQTWTAIWLGSWNDVLVNLPWGCYYVSAVLFVYATVAARVARPWALPAALLLAGTPLFLVHAAIAGYADLILGVHFAAAALAVYLWASEQRHAYLLVAGFFVASLPFIKLEGIPLAVACGATAAMQVPWLRRWGLRWLLAVVAGGVALAVARRIPHFSWLLGGAVFHPEGVWALLRSLFGLGNWHLLWFLFFTLGALRGAAIWGTPAGWLWATVAAPMLPFGFVFLFTDAALFAVQQTAQARVFLGLAPAALLCAIILAADALRDSA